VTVYRLLWTLLRLVLRGRGRDDVCLSIEWDLPGSRGAITGEITGFQDAMCLIEGVSSDGPWSMWGPPRVNSVGVRDVQFGAE
jgi:hypothetical protein